VRAQIWDTSGSKKFLQMSTIHYRYAVGAFLMYDITDRTTFESLHTWLELIQDYSDANVQIALVGNKLDKIETMSMTVSTAKKTIFD
jgi:small GTP-binding protein